MSRRSRGTQDGNPAERGDEMGRSSKQVATTKPPIGTVVPMGGFEFSYAKRRNYNRCAYVCAGYSGLHPSGKWSTWSPGRFPIPKKDENLRDVVVDAVKAWAQQPNLEGGPGGDAS